MSNLRHLAIALILLTGAASAQVLGYQNFCQTGGQTVKSQGLTSSTHVQRSYPSCTVTVFLTGTTNKATIFSDNFSTPRTNPFVANTDGSFLFYAATTFCYDVTISGGNTGDSVPAPFTYTDQCIGSGGGAGGLPPGCTASGVGQISCVGSPSFIATNGIVPGTLNIANFPVVPPKGTVVTAQDGANSSDCTLGGGSDVHQCLWTGTNWVANGGGGGGSGVSSVGLALPASLFAVTNSPVTGVGTLTGAFVTNFAANSVFGNCTVSLATPGPCSLTSAMIPPINLASSANGGVTGIAPIANGGTATSSTLTGLVRGGNPFTAAEISGDGTTSGSNALSVVALHFGATSIPTGTIPTAGQCLEYNGTNITGAVCSGGSGGPTISTNGVNNASQAVLNFSNPATFNGVTITYSNPSVGNETFTLGGTLNNAGLTNASVAVNSQTCTLGGTCTIPFSTNSVSNTSQAGINFINPATFNGLTVTFTNSATNQESFAFGGTLGNAGLTNPSVTVNGQTCTLGSICNVNSGAANPSLAQNNGAGAAISAASAHTVTIPRLCSDSSGSGTVQSCSTSPSFSPVSGDEIIYVTTTSNTGDVTVNVNAAGAKHVHKWSGASILAASDLVSNIPVVMVYDGTFWEAQTIGNAPTGGGGGTVANCGTIGGNTYYPAGGTTVNCDSSIIDNGSGTLSATQYQATGTTAGYVGLGGSVTNPTLSVNSAGWLGPTSASFTAYAMQLSSTGPSANTVMLFGAQSGGISQATFGTVPNAALTNPSTTVNSQVCTLGTTCAIGYANIAAGALANGTTATTQPVLDSTADVATDSFVTTAVTNATAALNPAASVVVATTGNLTGTYANGTSGVGATFTITATGAFTLDGNSINTIGQRVLLKNQTSAFQNGIYSATVVGTTGVSPVFTRVSNYNQPSNINNTEAVQVVSGTANATTSWILTSTVNTVGSDSLTYSQFTLTPSTIATLTGSQTLTNKTLTSPILTTPDLGTPTAATLTNATGLPVGGISATGTPSSTTFLRGDGTWNTPAGAGNVSNTGTPTSGQFAQWTSATVIQGVALSAINAQTATYQVLAADFSSYKTISVASGTFTITLVASGSQPANGQYINVINYGTGVVTIARSGQNINGGTTSLTIPAAPDAQHPFSAFVESNGTDYLAATKFPATSTTGTGNAVLATSPTLTTPKVTTITDANANPFIASTATASAVDSITVTNAATANPATVVISATGSDSNINLNLVSKGTGTVQCNGASCGSGGGASASYTIVNKTANYTTVSGDWSSASAPASEVIYAVTTSTLVTHTLPSSTSGLTSGGYQVVKNSCSSTFGMYVAPATLTLDGSATVNVFLEPCRQITIVFDGSNFRSDVGQANTSNMGGTMIPPELSGTISGAAFTGANVPETYTFFLSKPTTITNLSFNITTVQAASHCDFGIYDVGRNLITHTGSQACTAGTTFKVAASTAITLSPGVYTLESCSDVATVAILSVAVAATTENLFAISGSKLGFGIDATSCVAGVLQSPGGTNTISSTPNGIPLLVASP